MPGTPLLSLRGLTVRFPAVLALDQVDFALNAGEIHALMGENGAGKSTLINALSGAARVSAGTLEIEGTPVTLVNARDAERNGISTVHQELDLIPSLSIADNICLGRYPRRWGVIDRRATKARAETALGRLGVRLDIDRHLADFPIAVQQLVALSRALDLDAKVLILDEPTSSLDRRETEQLFAVLRRLREHGLGVILISHFLDQVYQLADRITVLRNGRRVGEWLTAALPRSDLIEAMTGRNADASPNVSAGRDPGPALQPDQAALGWQDLGRHRGIRPSSGMVRAGELVGFAGLRGAGRTELARLLFGADSADQGEVVVAGRRVLRGSVRAAIRAGLGFTPEDRRAQGLILDQSVETNILLAIQARRGALRPIDRTERHRLATHYIERLGIRTPSPSTPVRHLSGGNQQKVLLARWLAIQPKVLIFDEPTRGIDVGARAEIEALIRSLKSAGLAVVVISEELDELVRLSDRVLVLRDRAVIGELSASQISESTILAMVAETST